MGPDFFFIGIHIYRFAGETGFLRRIGNQVALDGAGDLGSAGWNLPVWGADNSRPFGCFFCQSLHEGIHQTDVSASVSASVRMKRDFLRWGGHIGEGAEAGDGEVVFCVVAADGTVFAHDFNPAMHVVGEGAHLESRSYAVLELDGGGLLVAHVVVAVENAAAVGALIQGAAHAFLRHIVGDVHGAPFANHGQVGAVGVEAAALAQSAVLTAKGASLRGVFRAEVGQVPEGGDFGGAAAHQPGEDVHVVAGFLQDDGTAGVGAVPLASHEGMGHVEVAHVFRIFDGLNSAQLAGVDDVLDSGEELRVAQHVAHHDQKASGIGGFLNSETFFGIRGDGFLQEQMVSGFQKGHGAAKVILVHGGHHRRISDAALRQKIFQAGKSLRNMVVFHGSVSPGRDGFHDGADFNSFFPEVGGVNVASLSGSDECNSHMGLPVCENIHYIIEGGGDFYKYKETIAGKSCRAERLFLMLGG